MGLTSTTLKTSPMQNVIALTRIESPISVDLPIRKYALRSACLPLVLMGNKFGETLYCIWSTLLRHSDQLRQSLICWDASLALKVRHPNGRTIDLHFAGTTELPWKEQSPSAAWLREDYGPWLPRQLAKESQKADPRS